MNADSRSLGWSARIGFSGAAVICLLLIVVALLLIANEIRFQGCVASQHRQALVEATKSPRNPAPVTLECHRLPFR